MDAKVRLTENFTVGDVQFNELAVRLGIKNEVPEDLLINAQALAENILEPIIAEFGQCSITSWYRCENLEREYSRNSFPRWCIDQRRPIREESWDPFLDEKRHHTAECVTIRQPNLDKVFDFIKALDFDVLEHKTHWISVSYGRGNHKHVIDKV